MDMYSFQLPVVNTWYAQQSSSTLSSFYPTSDTQERMYGDLVQRGKKLYVNTDTIYPLHSSHSIIQAPYIPKPIIDRF
jgi:hypothetical protein